MTFILCLGIVAIIVGHEAGHLLAARAWGLKSEEVGIGFGPVVHAGKRVTWRAVPLGGYVKLPPFRSPLEAATVALAGPLANFGLAYGCIAIGLLKTGIPIGHGAFSTQLIWARPWEVLRWAGLLLWGFTERTIAGLTGLLRQPADLAGPVWLVKSARPFLVSDPWNLLAILALCSISIGLFNLLPWPGLDGSHFLISLLPKKWREPVQTVGLKMLLGLALVVTVKDILI